MTPEKFFLGYALPCAEFRRLSGKITADQTERLFQIIEDNTDPDRALLEICYSDAYMEMRALAEKNNREIWGRDNVQDYWRNNHFGPSPVEKLYVWKKHDEVRIVLKKELNGKEDGKIFINMFNIQLLPGDDVYIHQSLIIEKA